MSGETDSLILMHIEAMREDFAEERRMAHESRAVVHKRLDDQAKEIADLKTQITVSAHVLDAVKSDVEKAAAHVATDIAPTVAEWKHIKRMGIGIGGMLALGGLSIASGIAWFGQEFWDWLRHFLKVN